MGFITEEEMADQLARTQRNPNKGAHPLDLGSNTLEHMASEDTPGVGNTDYQKSDEAKDESREQGDIDTLHSLYFPKSNAENRRRKRNKNAKPVSEKYQATKTTVLGRSGGLGAADAAMDLGYESTDLETLELARLYKNRPKSDTRSFDEFIRGQKILGPENHKKGPNPKWVKRIDLDKVGYEAKVYEKLAELSKIWTRPDTEVVYRVGGRPELDQIIIKNPAYKGRFEKEEHETSFSLDELKSVTDKSGIHDLNITRPKSSGDHRFVEDLQHLKLGDGVLMGGLVSVEYSTGAKEKQEKENNTFNLKLNEKMLEKYTTEEEKGDVEDFLGTLKHTEVGWFGFEVSKNEHGPKVITGVTLVTKAGERTTLPAHLFRKIFENVLPYKNSEGFTFIIPGGKRESVYPGMTHADLEATAKKLRIDGKELPQDTIYYI